MLKKNITSENVKLNQTTILDKIGGKFVPQIYHLRFLSVFHDFVVVQ